MKCLRCGEELYRAKEICLSCRKLENSYRSVSTDRRAYREAGHAVMSYLVRNGFTDKYVPLVRSGILPAFEKVAIEGESANWAKRTPGLGSLITVPQVLLAGYLAEAIKYGNHEAVSPRTGLKALLAALIPDNFLGYKAVTGSSLLVDMAHKLLGGYLSEYDYLYPDARSSEWLQEMMAFVEETLRKYWVSVESLATALLQVKTLSEEQSFVIIRTHISDEDAAMAQTVADQTVEEKLAKIFKL